MSDTHDLHFRIDVANLPPADIFIHSGDFTKYSTEAELTRFREFLNLLPYKYKIVVAGNHDFGLDKIQYEQNGMRERKHMNRFVNSEEEIKKLKQCCIYLEHQSVNVQGLNIFGSPYSPEFFDWGFMYKEGDGQKLWSMIPENTDILITHGPPYGILDKNYNKMNCGCKPLLEKVMQIKPKLHVFGHIHEGSGQ